jgi:hypothetical protein
MTDKRIPKPPPPEMIGGGVVAADRIEEREKAWEYHVAQLRHAYAQLAAGMVKDQKQFADGLIAPVIRALEERK